MDVNLHLPEDILIKGGNGSDRRNDQFKLNAGNENNAGNTTSPSAMHRKLPFQSKQEMH
jgi:hypothetical protein